MRNDQTNSRQEVDKNISADEAKPEIKIPPEVRPFEIERNLPMLRGTERQVAWARKIRYSFLTEAEQWLQTLGEDESLDGFMKASLRVFADCGSISDAKIWIEGFHSNSIQPVEIFHGIVKVWMISDCLIQLTNHVPADQQRPLANILVKHVASFIFAGAG